MGSEVDDGTRQGAGDPLRELDSGDHHPAQVVDAVRLGLDDHVIGPSDVQGGDDPIEPGDLGGHLGRLADLGLDEHLCLDGHDSLLAGGVAGGSDLARASFSETMRAWWCHCLLCTRVTAPRYLVRAVRCRRGTFAVFVFLAVVCLAAGFVPAGLRPQLEAVGLGVRFAAVLVAGLAFFLGAVLPAVRPLSLAPFVVTDFRAGALMVVSSIVAVAAATCSEPIAFSADTLRL